MPTLRVIVTRPALDAERWAAGLTETGFEAEALPLIDIAPLTDTAQLLGVQQAWQALASYRACLFVSSHAVCHFFDQNKGFPHVPYSFIAIYSGAVANAGSAANGLTGPRFLAPGPGTVAALRSAGVPAERIDAPAPDAVQFDSEALWRVVSQQDWRASRVLVVRGQSPGPGGIDTSAGTGRDWITRQWIQAGASVDFISVYQRRAPVLTGGQLVRARQASADGSAWLFSSSEAVGNLLGQAGLTGISWQRAKAVATHPRIAQAVRAAGWGVVVESRPALADVRQALGSIESAKP